jgi:regulator of RNase E activity RraA
VLKTFNDFERRPDLLAKFDALLPSYSISCIFADVMYRQNVMTAAIKPAFKAKATGQAVTVQLSGGDLVDPLRALEEGQAGDIIDGAGRDVDELEDINWPIWTRAITARGTHTMFSQRKEELSINVPIQCGGVVVNPGDFIVADTNAVVVVPLARAEEMLALAAEQAEREQRTREWVGKGKTIEDLLAEFGRI